MKQTISIENLWCEAIIGIYPHERDRPQPLRLRLSVEINAAQAVAEDNIVHTLDYDALVRLLKDHVEGHSYHLLETLLARLLEQIARFDVAQNAALTIEKPKALEQLGASVAVSGRWERRP